VTHCSILSHVLNMFGAGTHKMSDSEGYMKYLLGPEECNNVSISFTAIHL
jgi:hypothetical protein